MRKLMVIVPAVTLFVFLLLVASWGLGLPPGTWIEKNAFMVKANRAITGISTPTVPPGIAGDVFAYPDGWIVILYGQSSITGHNLWNYNLAKDSTGREYVCERHFCTSIKAKYAVRTKSDAYYLASNPGEKSVPNLPDPEFADIKVLVESMSLVDGVKALTAIGFSAR